MANIVAHNINTDTSINGEDIFAYTYACPAVSQNVTKYNNIHNFVHMEDFVPLLPLKQWGYGRHGKTYHLPSKATFRNSEIGALSTSGYIVPFSVNNLIADMEKNFIKLTGENEFVWYSDGYRDSKKIGDYIFEIASSAKDVYKGKDYYRYDIILNIKLIDFFNDLGDYFSKQEFIQLLKYFPYSGYSSLQIYFVQNGVLNQRMFNSHAVDTYISWMESFRYEDNLSIINSLQKLIEIQIKCPVNVYIYNQAGTLVGRVENDIADESLPVQVQVVVEGNEKTIYLCGEDDYRIEIIATDNGTMNYSVSEIHLDDGMQRRVLFDEINLEPNKAFNTTISVKDMGSNAAEYALNISNGAKILPSEVLYANSVENVKISVIATEGGYAVGNSLSTKGDLANVSAVPMDDYVFKGWFENGVLISEQADYSFIVKKDCTLEARFAILASSYPSDTDSNTSSNTGNSGGGSGGGRASSSSALNSVNTIALPTAATYWLTNAEAQKLAKAAKDSNLAYIRTRSAGIYGVKKDIFALMQNLRYEHDTLSNNAVQLRISIPEPAKITTDLLMSGYVEGATVNKTRAFFEKWYSNKLRVISFEQQGDWGQLVKVAAKVDFTNIDTNNLVLYSYSSKTNSFKRITAQAYWIDKNGYIHFATEIAGDIIISEGALVKR